MLLEKSFPIGSTVLNCKHHLAEVIGYQHNMLIVKGVGAYHAVGQWLANPKMTTRLSNGHFGISGHYEYFMFNDNLYRAPMANPIDQNGIRQGARWEMPKHLVTSEYLRMIGL